MKFLPVLACAILVLTALAPCARATTPMGDSMKKMEDACHQLGPDLKQTDPTKHNKTSDLAAVATIKEECVKSQQLVPKKVSTLPPDQQPTMTTDYGKAMEVFIQHVDTLNQDIVDEKWDVALADFQKLMKEQHDDHKLFRIKT